MCYVFFFYVSGAHRDLHVLTHAFPTRRSSDLAPTIGDRLGSSLGRFDEERGTLLFHRHALEADFGRADQPPAGGDGDRDRDMARSEEHTSELQSLMRISYAVFCLKKKKNINTKLTTEHIKQ